MLDEDGMVVLRVPPGTIYVTAEASAEVIKAADIQPQTEE
jgi:hypothetical protein